MKHEENRCPRCEDTFQCKVGDVVNCQCSQVTLTPETYRFISANYSDCLCQKCLLELNKLMGVR
ncbi:MAG: cysteine-rich CWC family protein [Bacteroidota bacterium]